MGRMSEDTMEPSEPVCDECGAPLEFDDDRMVCTAAIPCLKQVEDAERR